MTYGQSLCAIQNCAQPAIDPLTLSFPSEGPERGRFIRGDLPLCGRHRAAADTGEAVEIAGERQADGILKTYVRMPGLPEQH